MTAIPFPVPVPMPIPVGEESEVVERRASAWSDPRTWVSIIGVLLTLSIAVGGFVASKLYTIDAKMENLLVASTKQTEQNDALKARVQQLENFRDTQEKAYNFNFTTRLAGAESDIKAMQNERKGK